MARKQTPRALMTPSELHILMSFAQGPRHGYAVQKDVTERSAGKISLGPGTLYEAIHRMLARGWIEEAPEHGSGRRKAYRLRAEGQRELRQELRRLEHLVAWAKEADLLAEEGAP